MDYKSSIIIKTDHAKDIKTIFNPENKDSPNQRASYDIITKKDIIEFKITAKDSVSLRATLNSITKLLTVYEKLNL